MIVSNYTSPPFRVAGSNQAIKSEFPVRFVWFFLFLSAYLVYSIELLILPESTTKCLFGCINCLVHILAHFKLTNCNFFFFILTKFVCDFVLTNLYDGCKLCNFYYVFMLSYLMS